MLLNKGEEVLVLPPKSRNTSHAFWLYEVHQGRWQYRDERQALESEDEGWIHSCAINTRTVLDTDRLVPSSSAS